MQQDLTQLRQRVDEIDELLVRLLNERAALVVGVGRLRTKAGVQMYDPARELTVLKHIVSLNKGPLNKGDVEDIFATIMNACRELQNR